MFYKLVKNFKIRTVIIFDMILYAAAAFTLFMYIISTGFSLVVPVTLALMFYTTIEMLVIMALKERFMLSYDDKVSDINTHLQLGVKP